MAAHHTWSDRSRERLATCDPRLISLMNATLKASPLDLVIIEGHRSHERQAELLAAGKSKLGPGRSKHNASPSKAVDVAILRDGKVAWTDRDAWLQFGGLVKGVAATMGLTIRWGGDWDGDFDAAEHGFWDGPHFELVED
ncbi:MAG: M15 family metallopeptidase [Alphaproteobacteria bacterium]|nr:M15 family metallopeptidase [Alphaproteobacteria bacterium]